MRILRYVILFCLLFVLVSCNDEVIEQHTFPDAEYAVNATDMAVVGDKIYYISEEKVYEVASDEPVFTEFPAEFLASNGAELAIYGNGQIYCSDKTYTVPQTEIDSFVYVGNTVCWSYIQEELPKLGFYNTSNDDSIAVAPLTGVNCAVMPYREDSILVCCYEISGEMYAYEFDTVTMKPGSFQTEEVFRAAAFHGDTLVTLLPSGRIALHHLTDETEEKRNPCEEMTDGIKKLSFSGESAIFLSMNGTVYTKKDYCTPIEAGNTVVILQEKDNGYVGDMTLNMLNTALEEQNIEVVVSEYTVDQIKLKQLAGDDDYDLYTTDGFHIVLDYPIYEPLNDYKVITDQFDLMYDEIRKICTFDDRIYGVLIDLQVQNSLWGYNSELLDALEMTLPEPDWTLEDYFEMAVEIRASGHYISKFHPLFLSDYIHVFGDMYHTKSLTDDGSILRKYLEIMKQLQKEGLFYDKDTAEEDAKTLFGGSYAPFEARYNAEIDFNEFIVEDVWYPVTFDGTLPDLTIMTFLQMNRNSLNKEKAASVMAEYMKREYIEQRNNIFYKETGEALRSTSEKAEKNFQIYLDVLSNSRPRYSFDNEVFQYMNHEAEKYYNDEQDLELTVEKIYARAKMIFEE